MQKANVGKMFGSRIGRLVGFHQFFAFDDPHFSKRLRMAEMTGITRDEIGVWNDTGLFAKLDGRGFDLDEA